MKIAIFLIKILRFGVIVTPFVVFWILSNEFFGISGKLEFTYDFGKVPTFTSSFYPFDRAPEPRKQLRTGTRFQEITGDPVYMDVDVPRSFDTVDVSVDYINSGQPFIEFGLLTYVEPYGITLLPFESTIIEEAEQSFEAIDGIDPRTGTPVRLYQRESFVSSVEEFFAKPPNALQKRIVTYGVDLPITYRDPQYQPQTVRWDFPLMLRGSHTFMTYIKDEALVVDANIVDLNREQGADTITMRIVNEKKEEVYRTVIQDDGNTGGDRQKTSLTPQQIAVEHLPEGVYTIDMIMTNDNVLQTLSTQQQYFVVKDIVQTISPAEFDDLKVSTSMTNEDDKFRIQTHGFFASSPEHFFDPLHGVRALHDEITLGDVDILVTKAFSLPQRRANRTLRTQTVHLDLRETRIDRKHMTFVLSAPGISARNKRIEVRAVRFSFKRDPLWKRMITKFL